VTGNRRGIVAMLIAAAVFSLMDTGLKLLSPHYPPVQVAAMRSLASLPLILLYVGWRSRFRGVLQIRWGLQILRAVLGVGILSAFTLGVRKLPLAEAYSIFFIAPAFIAALSAFILKERVEHVPSFRSTAAPSPRRCWSPSCSDTSRARSPAPSPTPKASFRPPTPVPCSWTKSARCLQPSR
jgi:hypothetical protein